MSTDPAPGSRRRLVLTALAGAIVLACLIAFGIGYVNRHSILNTISDRLATPSSLAGSRVIKGNPVDFLVDNQQAAEVKLTKQGARTLLSSTPAFKDCRQRGRECSTPTWALPIVLLGGDDGINMPDIPGCAQSYQAGSHATRDAFVVCVDIRTDILYFYKWDERDR